MFKIVTAGLAVAFFFLVAGVGGIIVFGDKIAEGGFASVGYYFLLLIGGMLISNKILN